MKNSVSPADATYEEILRIDRDNIECGDFSILVCADSETVYLTEQRIGESPTQKIEIPRATFNKLIKWYQSPQKIDQNKLPV